MIIVVLTPSSGDSQGHQRHHHDLGDLADRHISAGIGRLDSDRFQEEVLAGEVESEHDPDQAGDHDEHGERAVSHELEALDDCRALGDRVARLRGDRRRVGQRQAVKRVDDRRDTRDPKAVAEMRLADERDREQWFEQRNHSRPPGGEEPLEQAVQAEEVEERLVEAQVLVVEVRRE